MGECTPLDFLQKTLNQPTIPFFIQDDMFRNAIEAVKDKNGLYMEFGLFVGTTAKKIIQYIPQDKYFYGFEGFCGLEDDVTPEALKGITEICGELPEYPKQIKVIVGKLQNSLPQFLRWHPENISFVNFDVSCSTVKYGLFALADAKRLKAGTVIVIGHAIKLLNGIKYDTIYKSFQEFVTVFNVQYEYICFGDVHMAIRLTKDV